jgi:hypothetical protein
MQRLGWASLTSYSPSCVWQDHNGFTHQASWVLHGDNKEARNRPNLPTTGVIVAVRDGPLLGVAITTSMSL